jgi:dipeptidyl aminopeptidase/acylaminoacyl peptidase
MGGSLWRQRIGETTAVELTHAQGAHDFQPDVASDGRSVVFTRYDGRAMELWRLDLQTGREQALTNAGAVNTEPRLSPDGRRLAWVSTEGTGHFNLFLAEIDAQGLHGARLLLGERQSRIDRYYYSSYDHAVNPAWTPDGKSLYFLSNHEVSWGSGDIWVVPVDRPADARRILSEETTWRAHPDPAPAGARLLYSSYRGRQWHQLWMTTLDGAAPLPLTFGDFDVRNARWAPDGRRVAFISNERGGTSLVVQDTVSGARKFIEPGTRRTLAPQARLEIDILDESGQRTPARVAVLGSDGRAYAPDDAWMHGDDGFDPGRQAMETHYFHCQPPCALQLPAGAASVWVQHGFEYAPWRSQVQLAAGAPTRLEARLQPDRLPADFGRFVSADLHVHMNYGGHYRNTPAHLAQQARAEDLDVVHNLIVNKEERIPDVAYFSPQADPAGAPLVTIFHSQEYHTSFWGHLGLLHLGDHLLLPSFVAYRHTAMASAYPHNGVVADLAHQQGGLVGYVHPFDTRIVPEQEKSLSNALPADVMAGRIDYLEVVGFAEHRLTAEVWYRLLNLGFRLPAGAGTDAMANYASLRGPVGLNRVFLDTGGRRDAASLKDAVQRGRGFASNGPLLGLEIGDAHPGDTLRLAQPGQVNYRVALRSPVAVDHLELVMNGAVVQTFKLEGDRRRIDASGSLPIARSGWLLLRAWNDGADPQVLDMYPYATTSPVYLAAPEPAPAAVEDARYFVAWLDRVLAAAAARTDYNDDEERRATLDYLQQARAGYAARAGVSASSGQPPRGGGTDKPVP